MTRSIWVASAQVPEPPEPVGAGRPAPRTSEGNDPSVTDAAGERPRESPQPSTLGTDRSPATAPAPFSDGASGVGDDDGGVGA
jgi:hypothetical protein